MTTCASCNGSNAYQGFYTASGAYHCHTCCHRNVRALGFYGPPGTRSLQEAGGRTCVRCGTDHTSDWGPSKKVHGRYVCNSCRVSEWRELKREPQGTQAASGRRAAPGKGKRQQRNKGGGVDQEGGEEGEEDSGEDGISGDADGDDNVPLSTAAAAAAAARVAGKPAAAATAVAAALSPSGGGGIGHGGERLRRAAAVAADGGISRCLGRMALGEGRAAEAGGLSLGAGTRVSAAHRGRVKPEPAEEEKAGEVHAAKRRRVAGERKAAVEAAQRDAGGESKGVRGGGGVREDKAAGGVRKGAGGMLVPSTPSSTGGATGSGTDGGSSSSRSSGSSSAHTGSGSGSKGEGAGHGVGRLPTEQRRGAAAHARGSALADGGPAPAGTTRTCVHCGQAVDLAAGVRGVFYPDRRFVCHCCCSKNLKELGFYGPPGCRTLEEAGGRACSTCGCSGTRRWYHDPTNMGSYLCSGCYDRNRNRRIAAARAAAKAGRSDGTPSPSKPTADAAPLSRLKRVRPQGEAVSEPPHKRRAMKPWAGAATAAAAAGDGGRHDVGAAGGVQADGGEQGVEQQEQEQGVQQEQKEEEEQEQDEELGAVVQQVEELEEAVRSLCEVLAHEPMPSVPVARSRAAAHDPPAHAACRSPTLGQAATDEQEKAEEAAVRRLAWAAAQSAGWPPQARVLHLGDIVFRWLELRVWRRPLSLLLGPPADALNLDARGSELRALGPEQQARWEAARRSVCRTLADTLQVVTRADALASQPAVHRRSQGRADGEGQGQGQAQEQVLHPKAFGEDGNAVQGQGQGHGQAQGLKLHAAGEEGKGVQEQQQGLPAAGLQQGATAGERDVELVRHREAGTDVDVPLVSAPGGLGCGLRLRGVVWALADRLAGEVLGLPLEHPRLGGKAREQQQQQECEQQQGEDRLLDDECAELQGRPREQAGALGEGYTVNLRDADREEVTQVVASEPAAVVATSPAVVAGAAAAAVPAAALAASEEAARQLQRVVLHALLLAARVGAAPGCLALRLAAPGDRLGPDRGEEAGAAAGGQAQSVVRGAGAAGVGKGVGDGAGQGTTAAAAGAAATAGAAGGAGGMAAAVAPVVTPAGRCMPAAQDGSGRPPGGGGLPRAIAVRWATGGPPLGANAAAGAGVGAAPAAAPASAAAAAPRAAAGTAQQVHVHTHAVGQGDSAAGGQQEQQQEQRREQQQDHEEGQAQHVGLALALRRLYSNGSPLDTSPEPQPLGESQGDVQGRHGAVGQGQAACRADYAGVLGGEWHLACEAERKQEPGTEPSGNSSRGGTLRGSEQGAGLVLWVVAPGVVRCGEGATAAEMELMVVPVQAVGCTQ